MSNEEKWDVYTAEELALWERHEDSKGAPWAKARGKDVEVCVFPDGASRAHVIAAVHIWDDGELTTLTVNGDGGDNTLARLDAIRVDIDGIVPPGTVQWAIDRVRAAGQVIEWLKTHDGEEATA